MKFIGYIRINNEILNVFFFFLTSNPPVENICVTV